MVPAGKPVDDTIAALLPGLGAGDILIDGGNSNYKDTMRRARELAESNIRYVDSGTSGGIWGLREGYSMMIGGDAAAVERLRRIFEALAPEKNIGWGRVGASGAGHFREDGPQRHRVRTDAGLRRRILRAQAQGRVRIRPARSRADLAARQRRAFLAA
jgi:hypothetical protein